MGAKPDAFAEWYTALERRHLGNLDFAEVRRAVQALSSLYVERRNKLSSGAALDGAGKRAAFGYFFGALHFLLIREVVRALKAAPRSGRIMDLGCGTGIAGAAWALEAEPRPAVLGIDRSPWAVQEAKWTYHAFGIEGTARVADVGSLVVPSNTSIIAAFIVNELDPITREKFLGQFIGAARRGAPVLIIEPVGRRLTPWWDDWAGAFQNAGGQENEWRFRAELPERLALMDRAAGLDHRELTCRSLWLSGMLKSTGHDLLSKMRPAER